MKKKLKRVFIDYKRRNKGVKIILKKKVFKSLLTDYNLSLQERQIIYKKYNNFNYKYTVSKFSSNCYLSGQSRAVYQCVQLSRHFFKDMVLNGYIPSCI